MDEQKRKLLGANITKYRKLAKKSQQETADYLQIPRTAISLIESGDRKTDVLELVKIANFLDATVDCLLWNVQEMGATSHHPGIPERYPERNDYNSYPFTC